MEQPMQGSGSSMQGKTVLITGADGDIGKNTVKGIALKGARIVMACLDAQLAEPIRNEIVRQTGNKDIEIMQLDLASQADIRRFAAEFAARYDRLDVLINNAGVFSLKRFETEDGLERTIGINYFGHYLLTTLLLPVIKRAGKARIINVCSDSYKQAVFDPDNLQTRGNYKTGMEAYSLSKLAIVLFTQELAEQLQGTGVTVNALHPGHVATGIWNMWEHPKWYQRLLIKILNLFLIAPEKGALTSIYLACSDEVSGITGKYFSKQKPVPVKSKYNTPRIQKELWGLTKQRIPS
jgi:NAD(P)-dependent dehydrogenase (short-subunit alcohol dehydrogenase family)